MVGGEACAGSGSRREPPVAGRCVAVSAPRAARRRLERLRAWCVRAAQAGYLAMVGARLASAKTTAEFNMVLDDLGHELDDRW